MIEALISLFCPVVNTSMHGLSHCHAKSVVSPWFFLYVQSLLQISVPKSVFPASIHPCLHLNHLVHPSPNFNPNSFPHCSLWTTITLEQPFPLIPPASMEILIQAVIHEVCPAPEWHWSDIQEANHCIYPAPVLMAIGANQTGVGQVPGQWVATAGETLPNLRNASITSTTAF